MTGLLVVMQLFALVGGCSPAERPPTGQLKETAGARVPAGMLPAVIYEIDGDDAFVGRGLHHVIAGKHSIRVWPDPNLCNAAAAGLSRLPMAEQVHVESITLDVKAGVTYHIAAIVSTEEIASGSSQSVRRTVRPVVSRAYD